MQAGEGGGDAFPLHCLRCGGSCAPPPCLFVPVPDVHPISRRFTAALGVNTFVVTAPDLLQEQFSAFFARTTLYGRLAGKYTIVNVDIALAFDDKVLWERGRVPPPASGRGRTVCS